MDKISSLWPDRMDVEPVRTPFDILRGQARVLNELMESRIKASVMSLHFDADDARPFQYSLSLQSVRPSGSLEGLCYVVLTILHDLDIYPLEVRPQKQVVESEAELLELLREVLGGPDVRSALRILASGSAPEVYCQRVVPDDYYLAPLRTPERILQEQGWGLRKLTDNLVRGVVRATHWGNNPAYGRFRFGLYLQPGGGERFFPSLDYKIMDIEHGVRLYPVTVQPGEMTFNSEEDFVEFVHQELASEDVRNAVRIVASYTRESPLTEL